MLGLSIAILGALCPKLQPVYEYTSTEKHFNPGGCPIEIIVTESSIQCLSDMVRYKGFYRMI